MTGGQTTEPPARVTPACLRCATPVDPLQNFCPHCGAPRGLAASLPFEHYLVLGQSLGLIFRRACLTPEVPLRRRALAVLVLAPWIAFWGLGLQAQGRVTVPLVVAGLLAYELLRRKSPQA